VRIIAGEFRSRVLKTLPGMALRPTSDRLRETLFNILGNAVPGSIFVDCYAGSGAVGLEALSRGASEAIFLEQSKSALAVLRQNVEALGVAARSRVLEGSVEEGLARLAREGSGPGIIFLDPPYADATQYRRSLALITELPLARPDTLVVAEHAARDSLAPPPGWSRNTRRQGDSALSFFRLL